MKKILVPCDFSDHAVNAFRLAVDLARAVKAEIHLLHVIELPVMHEDVLTLMSPSFDEKLLADLKERAEAKFASLKQQYAQGHMVDSKIQFGAAVSFISDYAKQQATDIIVMGTKGVSGLEEVLIGSTAEKIVRNAICPVLVVKNYSNIEMLRDIVFPNSMEEGQGDLMKHVKDLQSMLKARLHIVWIDTAEKDEDPTIMKTKMEAFARRFMIADYTLNVFKAKSMESGVIDFTHTIHANMIAMGTHARKGLSHFFKGSIAEDVVNHVDCPIWTYIINKG